MKKQQKSKSFKPSTEQELIETVNQLRDMLVDVLLPARFQDKPNTFIKAKLNEALATNKYTNPIVKQAMRNALKWPQPDEWLKKAFSGILDAIEEES